jgi:hypothetical protein
MDAWKLVLDEEAFQSVLAGPAAQRRALLVVLDGLRNNPSRKPDYFTKDATGRALSVVGLRPFLITYWLDSFVSEVRIVNIQRIRY